MQQNQRGHRRIAGGSGGDLHPLDFGEYHDGTPLLSGVEVPAVSQPSSPLSARKDLSGPCQLPKKLAQLIIGVNAYVADEICIAGREFVIKTEDGSVGDAIELTETGKACGDR